VRSAGGPDDTGLTRFCRRFFVTTRVGLRLSRQLGPGGVATTPALRRANLAAAALDAGEWLVQRRARGAGVAWRLPLDVAEGALWAGSEGDDYFGMAWTVAAPLALEATSRYGPAGLAVPAVAATAFAALTPRRPTSVVTSMVWPIAAALGGLVAHRIRTRRMADVEQRHTERLAAEVAAADLAGRHAVAAGADSVVDRLEAVAPLLGHPAPGSALFELLDAWKRSLAEGAAGVARYLGAEVTRWERHRNLHPDLASHVEVTLAEGDGTELLSALQVTRLRAALDQLGLRGRVDLRVEPSRRTRPSDPLVLRTSDHRIVLPADEQALGTLRYDLTAAQLFAGFVMTLAYSAPGTADVPLRWSLPVALAYPALAVWTRRNRAESAHGHPDVVALSTAIAAAHVITAAPRQRRTHDDRGIAIYPLIASLEVPIGTLGFSWDGLSPGARTCTGAAIAALALAAFALGRRPRSARSAMFEVCWHIGMLTNYAALPRMLREEADEVAARLAEEDHTAVEAAYRQGRQEVLDLVGRARDDARAQLAASRAQMDPELAGEVERRLVAVDELLEDLCRAS